jgi:DNA-binding transcriptional LysR family regulator
LLRLNCLTYAGAANREWRLSGPDGDHALKPSGNYRANNGDGIVEAALAGVGVGIVPRFIASPHLESGKLVQLLKEYIVPTGTLYAVFMPDPNLPERIRAFVRFLGDRFAPVPYWDVQPDAGQ